MGHEDNLVHALVLEVVNDGLHLAGEQCHVVCLAAITDETFHFNTAGGGDDFDDLCGDTDEADFLRALRDDTTRDDLVFHAAGFFEAADTDGLLVASGDTTIT